MLKNPLLYEINTRPWLRLFGAKSTLSDVPGSYWDYLKDQGIGQVWLMGVWQTAVVDARIRREFPERVLDYHPDERYPPFEYHIGASPYAIARYQPNENVGTWDDIARIRETLHTRGMQLILDFVPNHFSVESPWIDQFPEYFIQGDEAAIRQNPTEYFRHGNLIFAHGRDPYFPGWRDTVQVNYFNPDARQWMEDQLSNLAEVCDGVRCDMAMLLVNRIFNKTWQHHFSTTHSPSISEFWSTAIQVIKARHPEFQLMAEVYWDMEWELQQQGFDFTYDKRLLDRLVGNERQGVREHLLADDDYQSKLVRFLENHDEERALSHFGKERSFAAAIATYTLPGMRFFYDGQWEGSLRKVPVQMMEFPPEIPCSCGSLMVKDNPASVYCSDTWFFYQKLLYLLRKDVFQGTWSQINLQGNQQDQFFAWQWEHKSGRTLIVINYDGSPGTAYIHLPDQKGNDPVGLWSASEELAFQWEGDYLLIPLRPYQYQVFNLSLVTVS